LRNEILMKVNRWESNNYGHSYSSQDLQKDLFLTRISARRALDYLSSTNPPYIELTQAGDDEVNIRLMPAGQDQVESLEQINSSSEETFSSASLDQAIYSALNNLDPNLARSYEQVIHDINDRNKVSWRGTANEIREIVSGTLRELAPDEKVTRQKDYKQQPNTNGPTQSQRAKFIMSKRNASSKQSEFAKEVDMIDIRVAGFIRKFYDRASDGAHRSKERKEIRTLHSYLVPLLRDLLDIE
jgi:hypothetical protein